MEALTLPVFNIEGQEVGNIKLDSSVFGGVINTAVIHQATRAYLASQRKGLASVKTREEVSGGGRKPWRQKGTGRARVGSSRSPLWRHGGVTFGPHPRDFSYSIPRKIKSLALKSALCAKLKENGFIVLDKFQLDKAETKQALRVFFNLKCVSSAKDGVHKPKNKVLLLLGSINKYIELSLRNISFVNFNLAKLTHAYEVITANKLIVTKDAVVDLTDRLKKNNNQPKS